MDFTARVWSCERGSEHQVIEVSFNESDIATARGIADSKMNFINVHNPGGIKRPPEVIRSRIIAGKLADAAVFNLLNLRISKSNLMHQFSVNEYDQSRQDGFQQPDPYDLEITDPSGKAHTVEVRSSFCYKLAPVNRIVNKLSIYGWYTSENKPIEDPRDWYWQFIYYLRPQDIPYEEGKPHVGIFEKQIEQGSITGYVVGGASRKLLEDRGQMRTDQDDAYYRAIFPICWGLDYWGMMEAMLGIERPPKAK